MSRSLLVVLALLVAPALASAGEQRGSEARNGLIAYSTVAGDHANLCLMSPNGAKRMRLTQGRRQDGWASWSPDGRKLAFYREASPRVSGSQEGRNRRILVMGPNRASLNISDRPEGFPGDGYPSWSPDGSLIAFTDVPWKYDSPSLWVMRPDGSDRRLVVDDAADASWSPDARSLAYVVVRGPVAMSQGVAVVGLDGTGQKLIAPGGLNPAWSPDGTRIAFDRPTGIFTIRPDGTDEKLLIPNGQNAAWSPDGEKLVFVRAGDLWSAFADGAVWRRLTKTRVYEYAPAWQPVRAVGTARQWERRDPSC
jgi:TolB protein